MNRDLTKGSVLKSMLFFSIPMILGDLLQQCYNIVDTLIVGQFLGKKDYGKMYVHHFSLLHSSRLY